MKFRKKPIVVEAIQYEDTKQGHKVILAFCPTGRFKHGVGRDFFEITTLEGRSTASPGGWIIKGVKGEFYPCEPEIFAMTYEPMIVEIK